MVTSMILQVTTRPGVQMPVSNLMGMEMYRMLQTPAIGGARISGVVREGHGVFKEKTFLFGLRAQSGRLTFPGTQKVKKEASGDKEPALPSGTRKIRKLPATLKLGKGRKDNSVVFVAGATGKVGRRVVRELLKLGFRVRAGVRDVARGQTLLEMVDETQSPDEEPRSWAAKLFRFRAPSIVERLELVECDLEREDAVEEALGDAGVVVCTIGASEKEALDITGPYRIDYKATKNLIEAATSEKVSHFVLVTSLGTRKIGWPASILNLFWGVLIWKAKAEKALEESGLPYTIVRPGGMERPTDSYKETHNLVLAAKNTLSGGQVSSLQVAELIATCVGNVDLAKFKILEAVAETTAPLRPIEDLVAEAPAEHGGDNGAATSTGIKEVPNLVPKNVKSLRPQEKKSSRAAEADERKKKELQARYERDLLAAREKEEAAKREADEAASQIDVLKKRMADLQVQARTAAKEAKKAKALETATLIAARQGRRLSEKEKKEIVGAAAVQFEAELRAESDTGKVQVQPKKEPAVPTSSKAGKSLQMKAQKTSKEAENRANRESVEKERLKKLEEEKEARQKEASALKAKTEEENKAKASAEAAEITEKQRIAKEESARIEKENKIKAEAESKSRTEEDSLAAEEKKEKGITDAESKSQAKIDRIAKEEAARKETEAREVEAKAAAEATKKAELEEKEKKEAEAREMLVRAIASRQETSARERDALEKAKAQTFRWAWKNESAVEKTEPAQPVADVLQTSDGNGRSPSSSTTQSSEESDFTVPTDQKPEIVKDVTSSAAEVAENVADAVEDKVKKAKDFVVEKEEEIVKSKEEKEGALLQPSKVDMESAESNGSIPSSSDTGISLPSSIPDVTSAIEKNAPEIAQEFVENAEAMKEKAKQAKEEAAARATIALEKARVAISGTFRWPWQKEENELDDQDSSVLAPDAESEAVGKAEDSVLSTDGTPEVVKEVTASVASVAENVTEAVGDNVEKAKDYVIEKEEEAVLKSKEEKEDGPLQSSTADAVNAASSNSVPASSDTEVLPPLTTPELTSAVQENVPKLAQEVVETTEAMKEKAQQAKEEAIARATIALEKAQGATSSTFRWPWQNEESIKADDNPVPESSVLAVTEEAPTKTDSEDIPKP